MTRVELEIKRTRRSYSKQFKREVVAECQQGQSVSSVALKHNMNANIVHKWLRLAESGQLVPPASPFIPIRTIQAAATPATDADIRIEIVRGDTRVNVYWPRQEAARCAAWLSEWLR